MVNLFDDASEYNGYYETEIDLKQIDPTIKSISKFQDDYKTIEINNLNYFAVVNNAIEINDYNYPVIDIYGWYNWNTNLGDIFHINILKKGETQIAKLNFNNTITLYTDNIRVNDIQLVSVSIADDLPQKDYMSKYNTQKYYQLIFFQFQISKIKNSKNNDFLKKIYLEAYYTNDMKLKIRFSKVMGPKFISKIGYNQWQSWGIKDGLYFNNIKQLISFRNNSNNPVKITFKPR